VGSGRRKHGLVFLLVVVFGAHGLAQGLIIFNNRVLNEVAAPVYGVNPSDPARSQQGNDASYNGAPLADSGFSAQLFGGSTNTPVKELAGLTPATVFQTGAAAGYVVAPSRAVAVPGVPEGERAKMQLRAWDNRGGAITNWVQVLADPTIARGESLLFVTPPLGSVFTAPPNLVGLESFSLALPITVSSLRRRPDGQFQFNYINPTGMGYCVDVSDDLAYWTGSGTLALGSGTFVDTSATNKPRRFYRIVPCN
jgi:hypothetical protein